MGRAETITKLPIDRWARLMGINPVHFNQCYVPGQELNQICGSSWFQHDWQYADRVSRDQLADVIRQAEENIEAFLGYRLMPTWEYDEWHGIMARPYRPEYFNANQRDIRGFPTAVQADYGYVISGGIEAKSVIMASAAVVWSDSTGGDGLTDTGTVTVAGIAAAITACEIEVYFPGKAGADAYRIRPVEISLAAGTATITFRRELALLLAKWDDENDPRGVDYTADGNFISTVDVYRHYNNPQTQATLVWEPGGCSCGCEYTVQTACLLPRGDLRLGMFAFAPANWNVTDLAFDPTTLSVCREPDAIRLFYRSGWRDMKLTCPNQEMDTDLAYIVAIYAASMLDRKVCDCKGIQDGIGNWQKDLAFEKGATELSSEKVSFSTLDCPFGTRRGAIEAWRRLSRPSTQKARIGRPVLA